MNEDAERILRALFTSVEDGLRLLDAEPGLLDTRTGLGETPLHYLVVESHIEAIKALVERKGADVNTLNDFGGSPLSEAAGLGYVELVKYLLSVGAKLQLSEQKESVLHAAVRSGSAGALGSRPHRRPADGRRQRRDPGVRRRHEGAAPPEHRAQ